MVIRGIGNVDILFGPDRAFPILLGVTVVNLLNRRQNPLKNKWCPGKGSRLLYHDRQIMRGVKDFSFPAVASNIKGDTRLSPGWSL